MGIYLSQEKISIPLMGRTIGIFRLQFCCCWADCSLQFNSHRSHMKTGFEALTVMSLLLDLMNHRYVEGLHFLYFKSKTANTWPNNKVCHFKHVIHQCSDVAISFGRESCGTHLGHSSILLLITTTRGLQAYFLPQDGASITKECMQKIHSINKSIS